MQDSEKKQNSQMLIHMYAEQEDKKSDGNIWK